MNTRLSDLEQLVSEIKKFRPDCILPNGTNVIFKEVKE